MDPLIPRPMRWALPEAALLAAAALLARVDAAAAPLAQFGPFFAASVAAAGLWIGARYQRARVAFAMILIAGAAGALATATGPGLAARVVFQSIALLLPLNLAALAWSLDRGILTPTGLTRLGALAAQAIVVAAYATTAPDTALGLLDARLLPSHLTDWTRVGDLGVVAFALAAISLGASLALAGGAARRPWLWALAACFLALQHARPDPAPLLYLGTAALMLVVTMVEQTFVMAYHDGLTGLPARRALHDALLRLGDRYAIAMVDVDHFKRLNDTHGHDTGDQVLRMVASHLARMGGGGTAYRYGGEEFALLFPNTDPADAVGELERLRTAIARTDFAPRARLRPRRRPAKPRARKSPKRLAVTVSIGVAGPNGRRGAEAVLKAADAALYRAKKGGRNRVEA